MKENWRNMPDMTGGYASVGRRAGGSASPQPPLARFGVVVVAVLAALTLKLLLDPWMPQESTFLLFFGAVMVGAWYGGPLAGLLAIVLSALAAKFFFIAPVYSFWISESADLARLFLFVAEAAFLTLLTGALQHARRRADEAARTAIRHQETLRHSEEALTESRERYRAVVEQTSESIYMVDPYTMSILDSNAAFRDLLGYTEEELHGMTLHDIVADDSASIERNASRLRERDRLDIGERRYRRKDGSLVDVEVSASVIHFGGVHTWSVVSHDITDRLRAERKLQGSLDNLLAIYEAGRILGSSLEREEIASRLLEMTRRFSGLTAAVLSLEDGSSGREVWRTFGPEDVLSSILDDPNALDVRNDVCETWRHRLIELPEVPAGRLSEDLAAERLTGLVMPLLVRGRIVGILEVYGGRELAEEQTVETLTSIASQAASAIENARLYEDLTWRERELQDLVGRVIRAQEEERRRVAYEVHDAITQLSVAAYRRLEVFAEDHESASEKDREELAKITSLVREAVGESRRVIADLRPTALDDFGLAAAVGMQVEALREEGYVTDFRETLDGERLPVALETALYRVAQEALNNARKHARTGRVRVVLGRGPGHVHLEVRDWGRGFEPGEVFGSVSGSSAGPGEKVGVSSMRERLSLLGGEFDIRSRPGGGTTVVASIPIPDAGGETSHD